MIYLNDDLANFSFEASLPLLSEQRKAQALKYRFEQERKMCAMAYLLLCEGLELFTSRHRVYPYLDYEGSSIEMLRTRTR